VNSHDTTTRIRQANPVPKPNDLPGAAWSEAELLHIIEERNGRMRELMNDPELEQAKNRQAGWRMPAMVAGGAFLLVLIVVGVAALVGDEPPVEPGAGDVIVATTPSPPPSTAGESAQPSVTSPNDEPTPAQLAVATRFWAAWDSGDSETIRSMLAPGVGLEGAAGMDSVDGIVENAAFAADLSETTTIASCRLFDEIRVSCRLLVESAVTDALRSGPMIFQSSLQIENDIITRWQGDVIYYPTEQFIEFTDWVAEAYPDDRYKVSDNIGDRFNSSIDPAFALQLLNEYVAFRDAA
jgi:hypothetical protein